MKIGIIVAAHAEHQIETAKALHAGMAAHGDSAEIFNGPVDFMARSDFDGVCVWGWRRGKQFRDLGFDVLVMERAYVADRFEWISLGWNGLNGRAQWPDIDDPQRWETHFADLLKPWRTPTGQGYALLLGQVPSDSACRGVHLESWLSDVAERLRATGRAVVFRPHPKAPVVRVRGAMVSPRHSLADDLASADIAVTFNSNSGVEAVLAGVPTVAHDPGSMAWDVTSHAVDDAPVTPDRLPWAHRLAWRQWLPAEIASGLAWQHVKGVARGR